MAVIGTLNAEIAKLEGRLLQCLEPRPEYALLSTAPGIGRILGPIILLETGSIERFAAVGNYASYARCVDSVRLSNNKKKGEGNVRNGNKYLAWAFIEAANMAKRWCPEPGASMSASEPGPMQSSLPRPWRTSLRAPAITCSRPGSPSTCGVASANQW